MRRLHCPRTGHLKPPISDANPQFPAQRRKLKRNTGPRRGREVVQVYASRPDSAVERPAKWLAGFAAVDADPGETVEVGILIPERVFQHWSDAGWTSGARRVHALGRSLVHVPAAHRRLAETATAR